METINTYKDFLSEEQRLSIKDRVYSLKDYYVPVDPRVPHEDVTQLAAHTLGNSIYGFMPLRTDLHDIVTTQFHDIHQLTINKLKEIFDIDNIKIANFSCPSFHIFRGESLFDYFKYVHYHLDDDIFLNGKIDPDKVDASSVWSFMTLIENTKDPAYLDYIDPSDDLKDKKHYYEYGDFTLWRGRVAHRIGNNKYTGKDSRITYQGHMLKINDPESYIIYF